MENFDTHFNGFYKRLANKSTPTLAASTSADVTRRTKAHGQMPTAIVAVLFAAAAAANVAAAVALCSTGSASLYKLT